MGVRRALLAAIVAVGLLAAVLAAAAPSAQAEDTGRAPLPVPYGFLTALTHAVTDPYADPPGANDWSCRPSAEHPRPVVLVHGFVGSKTTNWRTISPLLANAGFCVYALTYGQAAPTYPLDQVGGFAPMESSAKGLDAFVAKVLDATGAEQVDLVGHSEGTLMPQYWLQFLGGAAKTDHYVAVTPLYDGTVAKPLPTARIADALGVRAPVTALTNVPCPACAQFVSGSPFLERMHAAGTKVPGVAYTTVLTRYDELVVPYTSGRLEGADEHVVQDGCPIDFSDHLSIISTRRTGQIVLNALDPAHAAPPPCEPVAPALGSHPLPLS